MSHDAPASDAKHTALASKDADTAIAKFLRTKVLEKPLAVFPKDLSAHSTYICCCFGWGIGLASCSGTILMLPVWSFCPGQVTKRMSLQVGRG